MTVPKSASRKRHEPMLQVQRIHGCDHNLFRAEASPEPLGAESRYDA